MNGECTIVRADIKGGPLAPDIHGVVLISTMLDGSEVYVHLEGLPEYKPAEEANGDPVGPHGFHIHEVGDCSVSDPEEPFQDAGEHWNPHNQPHGNHAGDFPVVFSNDGRSIMSFYTNRFRPADVVGKAIVVHRNPDDFRSQPSGDAGKRLACGVFRCVNV